MTRLSFGAALFIVLLRMAVGFHFFKEGETKLAAGNFSSAGYFRQSKGELSPFFKGLLADEDARMRLCHAPFTETGTDPALTFEYWEEFANEVNVQCYKVEQRIIERRNARRVNIQRLREDGKDVSELEKLYREDEQAILALRAHRDSLGPLLQKHMSEFQLFLNGYEDEIRNYFLYLDRLDGFERDGAGKTEVVEGVDSLWGQRNTVYGDAMKERAPLVAQVEAAWDALEAELNHIGLDAYEDQVNVSLYRPYEKLPLMRIVDQIVPWHHVIIGCMIFLGLFCRPASILGAFFLTLICASQLPWATGAQPIYYQSIELLALLALAAVGAGRYAGFDYFIERLFLKNEDELEGALNESHA